MGRFFNPKSWVGFVPNGLGQVKPNHFGEMLKTIWQNRSNLPYAWRILNNGVCDGCALGTTGMKDFTLDGTHLCTVRLNLLRFNTMGALDVSLLSDVEKLKSGIRSLESRGNGKKGGADSGFKTGDSRLLRELGRLPYPMRRRKGEPGFTRISWDEAYRGIAARIRPLIDRKEIDRLAFFITSRGLTNETYYVAQKAARLIGTNNIDNSARICHAPSTTALKKTMGVAASTCSYKDWIGTELLVFIGSNTPNNQPVTTKYMYYAKQKGTRIAVVNVYREPGLERYWVPSVFESAVFGTKIADDFFSINTGGDIGFLNGVLKYLIENDLIDRKFIDEHTAGFEELRAKLNEQPWEMLEKASGALRAEIERFAKLVGSVKSAIFVWSMGITQHSFGVENVTAIANLALARGFVGRDHCGVVPIRGHSGVQGAGEVGCSPWNLPDGVPLVARPPVSSSSGPALVDKPPVAHAGVERLEKLWNFEVPKNRGLTCVEMIQAAHDGAIDVLYSAGGNFLETLPEPEFVRTALERLPVRVHQDLFLTSQMLVEPRDEVYLLPAMTRYEQPGGGTETSTERQIIFSPEIAGPRIGEARCEWQIFMELAEHACPESKAKIHFENAQQVRNEIAQAAPSYAGIEKLSKRGDAVQWGGRHLCAGGNFPLPGGRAKFFAVEPPNGRLQAAGHRLFTVSTRRGKQFNSIVYQDRDPLTGADRHDILMNADDAKSLQLADGASVVLKSTHGEFHGKIKLAPIQSGSLQTHWPEGNVLLDFKARDPQCGVPDYNAEVEVVAVAN